MGTNSEREEKCSNSHSWQWQLRYSNSSLPDSKIQILPVSHHPPESTHDCPRLLLWAREYQDKPLASCPLVSLSVLGGDRAKSKAGEGQKESLINEKIIPALFPFPPQLIPCSISKPAWLGMCSGYSAKHTTVGTQPLLP